MVLVDRQDIETIQSLAQTVMTGGEPKTSDTTWGYDDTYKWWPDRYFVPVGQREYNSAGSPE
jgi:hypothetical protein